jgi:hypothetical protein
MQSSVSFYCKLTYVAIRTVREICKDFVSVKQRTLGGEKIMVNMEKYQQESYNGKIIDVAEGKVRDFIKPEVLDKFGEPDKACIQITVDMDGSVSRQIFTIPKVQGYAKSNLKRILEKNKLPNDTKKWVGKTVQMATDSKGFMHIAL